MLGLAFIIPAYKVFDDIKSRFGGEPLLCPSLSIMQICCASNEGKVAEQAPSNLLKGKGTVAMIQLRDVPGVGENVPAETNTPYARRHTSSGCYQLVMAMTKLIAEKVMKESARGMKQSKIAIVGISCRMPGGATDTEKFWDLLEQGLDVHKKMPADRFDDPAGKRTNASHTPYGGFIDEPGLFDAALFNISPREAQQTDPMQRRVLVTAYEALEGEGYVANRTAVENLLRIRTFYDQASDDCREVNAFGPGRINYCFKFSETMKLVERMAELLQTVVQDVPDERPAFFPSDRFLTMTDTSDRLMPAIFSATVIVANPPSIASMVPRIGAYNLTNIEHDTTSGAVEGDSCDPPNSTLVRNFDSPQKSKLS